MDNIDKSALISKLNVRRVGVVGLGMMGASISAALSGAGLVVDGYDVKEDVVKEATALKYIDAKINLRDLSKYDAVILALDEKGTIDAMRDFAPRLKDGAVVMDVCGVKRGVCEQMQILKRQYGALHFVGTHPMAGRETDGKKDGICYASGSMYKGAAAVLVPILEDDYAVQVAEALYTLMGVEKISVCDALAHDEMISYTSQLAHILSSSYAKNEKAARHYGFSAGSFCDLTRVARLAPPMWTDLFIANGDALLEDIKRLEKELEQYRAALESGDKERLLRLLEEGNAFKDAADRSAKESK